MRARETVATVAIYSPARTTQAQRGGACLVALNLDGWRELRILAAERDTTLNALAVEAFNDLLKKRGKQPLVQNPLASGD